MTPQQNLLPTSWRRRLLVVKRTRQWCLVWIAAGLLAGTACAGKYWIHRQHLKRLERIQAAVVPLRQLNEETGQLQTQLAQLQGRESLLATLDSSDHPLQIMGIVSQSAAKSSGDVRVRDFSLSSGRKNAAASAPVTRRTLAQQTTAPRATSQASQEDAPETVELRLIGTAADDMAITHFVNHLREYDVFDSVVLHSSQSTREDGVREFMIGCEYTK